MSAGCGTRDLAILVADDTMRLVVSAGIENWLTKPGVSPMTYSLLTSPTKDAGVLLRAHETLRPLCRTHRFAAAVFDYHGCGAEHQLTTEQAAARVQALMEQNGWRNRAKAICIDPELERWVICTHARLEKELGQSSRWVRTTLASAGYDPDKEGKLADPKSAWEELLRKARKRKSAALLANLASRLPLERCLDPAFQELAQFIKQCADSPLPHPQ
jgi:hypothetical protein